MIIAILSSSLITFTVYSLLMTQFEITTTKTFWISLIFGVKLFVSLMLSRKLQCLVCLMVPQILSRRGRAGLMAYAFILTIAGPAKNTARNMDILSESLTCEQEQLKAAYNKLLDVLKAPFNALRDVIKSILATIEEAFSKVRKILMEIVNLIREICKFSLFLYN